jgi:copper(I)-binding protein
VIQRRALIGVVLVAAIPVLTGCGLEVKDETSKETSPVQATDVSIGAIDVRDAFITYNTASGASGLASENPLPLATSGTGAELGYLVVTLVNNASRPDALVSVATSLGTIKSTGTSPTQLLPGVPVSFGAPETGGTGAMLEVSAGTPAIPGTNVPVTFSFANVGSRTIPVPVVVTNDSSTVPTQAVPTPTTTETLPSEGLQPAPD